jgi:FkbH-like protein
MKSFNKLKNNLKLDTRNLSVIKVALLGDTSTQLLTTALRGEAIGRNFVLDYFEADFNQIEQEFMNPNSDLHLFNPNYIIIFQSSHKLLEEYSTKTQNHDLLADIRISFIESISNKLKSKIIYFNYPEIDDNIYGSFSNKIKSSFVYQIRKLNFDLMNYSQRNTNFFICDISSIQNQYGRNFIFNPSVYANTEMVFSIDSLPIIASRTMDIICSLEGKFKKCLILDLDNTLWGGIIGDDGMENIQLGHGIGIGKMYIEFQHWIKKLKDRGVIIAICSKNDEDKAKEPFINHPEMILKLDDISVFMANWDNKVTNIKNIQTILNIGFDSMVFLDDNPAEREIVSQNIPEILVPNLPEDPSLYLEYLYTLNIFETTSYSETDKDRTKQYQEEAQRAIQKKYFVDEGDFLKSLNMESEVKEFNKFITPRVAQLSQRSNQFNLRTIRYSDSDIENIINDKKFKTFYFTLKDKFGDNGLISAIILEKNDQHTLFISSWFMSCRVLKRSMENFILNTVVQFALENGFKTIVGEYIPTSKNQMVKDLYIKMGFKNGLSENIYTLDLLSYTLRESFITKII